MLLIINSRIARFETMWPSPTAIQVNVTFHDNSEQVKFIYSGIQPLYNLATFTWNPTGFYNMIPQNINQKTIRSFSIQSNHAMPFKNSLLRLISYYIFYLTSLTHKQTRNENKTNGKAKPSSFPPATFL